MKGHWYYIVAPHHTHTRMHIILCMLSLFNFLFHLLAVQISPSIALPVSITFGLVIDSELSEFMQIAPPQKPTLKRGKNLPFLFFLFNIYTYAVNWFWRKKLEGNAEKYFNPNCKPNKELTKKLGCNHTISIANQRQALGIRIHFLKCKNFPFVCCQLLFLFRGKKENCIQGIWKFWRKGRQKGKRGGNSSFSREQTKVLGAKITTTAADGRWTSLVPLGNMLFPARNRRTYVHRHRTHYSYPIGQLGAL